MTHRRRKSDADRAVDALFDFLKVTPVWVGPVLAIVVYLLGRFVIPSFERPGEPISEMVTATSKLVAPWLAILVIGLWVIAEVKKFGNRRLFDTRSDANSLRSLSWDDFERLVGESFRRQGYTVATTPAGADGGVDLVLTKDRERTFVQCKQWKSWKVSVETVRELYGVVMAHGAVGGIVVCCGDFTAAARKFAQNLPLQLIDGPALRRMIDNVKRNAAEIGAREQLTCPEPSPSATPLCPQCKSPMVLRTARQGAHAGSQFYGCSKFPVCRGKRPFHLAT